MNYNICDMQSCKLLSPLASSRYLVRTWSGHIYEHYTLQHTIHSSECIGYTSPYKIKKLFVEGKLARYTQKTLKTDGGYFQFPFFSSRRGTVIIRGIDKTADKVQIKLQQFDSFIGKHLCTIFFLFNMFFLV